MLFVLSIQCSAIFANPFLANTTCVLLAGPPSPSHYSKHYGGSSKGRISVELPAGSITELVLATDASLLGTHTFGSLSLPAQVLGSAFKIELPFPFFIELLAIFDNVFGNSRVR